MSVRTVIAGNWKMNLGPREAADFVRRFDPEVPAGREVLLFPTALSLSAALGARREGSPVRFGVQNVHWEDSGAFTGEVSPPMAREAGATHVLVGHSERRHVFGESDEEAGKKTAAVLAVDLIPVVCVGETIEQRREGRVEDVIIRQLDAALEAVGEGDDWMVAYEPVWAIGTGETATPADAAAAHGALRTRLREALGAAAEAVPILYGGSVKPDNAAELLSASEVNGVLVGGASLNPTSFAEIVAAGG